MDEKTVQVLRMRDICHRATNVCDWLGEKLIDSDIVFDFIGRILNLRTIDRLLIDRRNERMRRWRALDNLTRRKCEHKYFLIHLITVRQLKGG
jgi:hypothetical protein